MSKNTERIELKTGSILCNKFEANSIFNAHVNSGEDVAWYTTEPKLALVAAQLNGRKVG